MVVKKFVYKSIHWSKNTANYSWRITIFTADFWKLITIRNWMYQSTGPWVYCDFYFYFCKYSYMQHTLLNFESLKNHTSNNLKHENTNTGWPAKLGIMFPGEFQVFRKKSNAKCTNVQMPIFQVCCRNQLPEISYKSIHATKTSVNLHAPLGCWK